MLLQCFRPIVSTSISIHCMLLPIVFAAFGASTVSGQESHNSESQDRQVQTSVDSKSLIELGPQQSTKSTIAAQPKTTALPYNLESVRQKLFLQLGVKGTEADAWLEQRIRQTVSRERRSASHQAGTETPAQPEAKAIQAIDFDGEDCLITASTEQHAQIKKCLDTLQEYGLRQVVIQTKIIRLDNGAFEDLPIDWTHIESVSKIASELVRPGTTSSRSSNVVPASFESAKKSEPRTWLEDAYARKQAGYRHLPPSEEFKTPEQQTASNWTQAISVTERSAPVLYTLLDSQQLNGLKKHLESENDQEKILSPTLLVFSGQTAEVGNSRERPFVTSMKPFVSKIDGNNIVQFQPKVRVYPEGTTLRLRPELRSDHIQLACELKISEIKSVDTFDMPQLTGQGVFTVQIPEVASTQFRSKMRIPIDYSLVVCALEKDNDSKSVATLVMCTCKVHDFDEAERLWNQQSQH
ncbi:MAG: hypothetical protein AB8B50_00335 [Pirellulaceae bacterium]